MIIAFPGLLKRYFPSFAWGAGYSSETLARDLVATAINHHADPPATGLCVAGGPTAAGWSLRVDGTVYALCDFRHFARTGCRSGCRIQPDNGRRRIDRYSRNTGLPGPNRRTGNDLQAASDRHRHIAIGISCQLRELSGDLGIHNRRCNPDRRRSDKASLFSVTAMLTVGTRLIFRAVQSAGAHCTSGQRC